MRCNGFLTGERIVLRKLEKADVQGNYSRWFNDPEVCKYNGHHRFPYGEDDLFRYVESLQGDSGRLVLAIVEAGTGIHIGNVSLQGIDYIDRSAEFAIVLGEKSSWGKGYSKDAAELIIAHGFSMLNLHRIYCGTSAENVPMQRLALAMGFSVEGKRREAIYKEGKYWDIVEYGLLRAEWIERAK